VLLALCCVAQIRRVLGVLVYACGAAHLRALPKTKITGFKGFNIKPIVTGFPFTSLFCKDPKRSFKTE
jgi:hypothetical protein